MSNTQPTPLSDEYFREMADLLVSRLATRQPGETDQKLVYITLKEVAKDVRHACAEVRAEPPFNKGHEESMYNDDERDQIHLEAFHDGQQAHADRCMNI